MECTNARSAGQTATARDRELFRYWQPEDIAYEKSETEAPKSPRSSNDPILTAFAQLGALRLNAKRGVISLTAKDNEYICAEAGRTLNVQSDDDAEDRLWLGASAVRFQGMGHDLVKLFCDADPPSHVIFNDLRTVPGLRDRVSVRETPHIRFLTCVPLRTASSLVIGNYTVVDDQPRNGLSENEIQFMVDMGVTVMDYLEAGRTKRKQHRAERMVKAMGLFIEGKASLREWWLQRGHYSQNSAVRKRTQHNISLDLQANLEFGVQDPADEFTSQGLGGLNSRPLLRSLSSSTLSHSINGDLKSDGRPPQPRHDSTLSWDASTFNSRSWHERNSSVTTFDATMEPAVEIEENRHSVAFDLPPETIGPDTSKELQDILFSGDLKSVFSRASNLIREAIAVDGVLFLDASVGSFGGSSEKDAMEEKAPGPFDAERLATSSDDDQNARRSAEPEINIDAAKEVNAQEKGKTEEKTCNILGFSTRRRSTLRGHLPYEEHKNFPETVLRRLLKKYPHGKVFNFEEDGSFSSGDSDNSAKNSHLDAGATLDKSGAHERKAQRKRHSKEADARAILSVLPKARSVFWFPLWDQNKERWFSGSLVWSTTPTRVFCPIEDLTYLAAFGNSIMSEVSRLSAQILNQMKTDFVASVSHELRSPLHGVLASVEFLQETVMSPEQIEMVQNVQTSATVLLDTLNHLLDFSKVNKKSKNKGLSPALKFKRAKKIPRSTPDKQNLDISADDIADVCVLSEEVVESIYAGSKRDFDGRYRQMGVRPSPMGPVQSPVAIIMDVNYHPSWKFEIDAGAWRRILMNLFNNALKFTKTGYVQVSLNVESDKLSRTKLSRSILTLKVRDSGKGIHAGFLKHSLFKPFTQEDTLAAGTGLGLSIVRHIVHDLGGEINFVSEQGVGTEATVRIPLTSIPQGKTAEQEQLIETRKETSGLKFSLEGFDRYPDISETPTGILSSEFEAAMLLKSSFHALMTEWFEMEAAVSTSDKASADVVVIMESGFGGKSVSEILQTYHCSQSPVAAKSIAIVLSVAYLTGPRIQSRGRFKIFYLPQPYGPHKVAKIMYDAFFSTGTIESFQSNALAQNVIASPITPIDTFSTESTMPTIFPEKIPTRRHSVQPSMKSEFPIAVKATKVEQGPKAKTGNTDPETSRNKKDPGDPVAEDPDRMRVLLVEDNEINLKLLVAYMKKLKLKYATACNGLEAVNAYKAAHGEKQYFDVIFMDISMPVMSGIESAQHIRRYERENILEPVVLIALTGAANPNTRQEAFSSGVDLFLTKPVPMKSLKVMLDDLKVGGRSGMGS